MPFVDFCGRGQVVVQPEVIILPDGAFVRGNLDARDKILVRDPTMSGTKSRPFKKPFKKPFKNHLKMIRPFKNHLKICFLNGTI